MTKTMFYKFLEGFKGVKRRGYLWLLVPSLFITGVLYTWVSQIPECDHMMFVFEANESILADKFIHKHEYEIILNNKLICDMDLFVMFLVVTDPKSFEKCQLIRNTWGSIKVHNGAKLRLAFLVGQLKHGADDSQLQPRLQDESDQFQDIVQGNFIDSYKNLTHKTVFALHWVMKYCQMAKFIFKVDDDVIVNVLRLVDFLQNTTGSDIKTHRFVYCNPGKSARPDRNQKQKGYITFSEYEYPLYPDYCHGGAILMSGDVVHDLYHVTKFIPHHRFEDIYIGFGMNLLELKITDDRLGVWFDIFDVWYKPVELCIGKRLGFGNKWSKTRMLASWGRIVSANESKFKHFIYLKLARLGIEFVILAITVSACAVSLVVLACKCTRYKLKRKLYLFS